MLPWIRAALKAKASSLVKYVSKPAVELLAGCRGQFDQAIANRMFQRAAGGVLPGEPGSHFGLRTMDGLEQRLPQCGNRGAWRMDHRRGPGPPARGASARPAAAPRTGHPGMTGPPRSPVAAPPPSNRIMRAGSAATSASTRATCAASPRPLDAIAARRWSSRPAITVLRVVARSSQSSRRWSIALVSPSSSRTGQHAPRRHSDSNVASCCSSCHCSRARSLVARNAAHALDRRGAAPAQASTR